MQVCIILCSADTVRGKAGKMQPYKKRLFGDEIIVREAGSVVLVVHDQMDVKVLYTESTHSKSW